MKAAPLRKARPMRDNRHATEVPSPRTAFACSSAALVAQAFGLARLTEDQAALRRAAFGADWAALTAVVVTAWKFASATSAACLAALWALS